MKIERVIYIYYFFLNLNITIGQGMAINLHYITLFFRSLKNDFALINTIKSTRLWVQSWEVYRKLGKQLNIKKICNSYVKDTLSKKNKIKRFLKNGLGNFYRKSDLTFYTFEAHWFVVHESPCRPWVRRGITIFLNNICQY